MYTQVLLPPPSPCPLLICASLRPFPRSDRFRLKWFVFDLTTTATPSSGADEGTPFPSEHTRERHRGHHSLRSGRKEGRQNVWRNCVLAACIRVCETLGGFGDDRRCVVGGGGGASRPLQRLCIAISLCRGWRVEYNRGRYTGRRYLCPSVSLSLFHPPAGSGLWMVLAIKSGQHTTAKRPTGQPTDRRTDGRTSGWM